jgi:hypothetical protein
MEPRDYAGIWAVPNTQGLGQTIYVDNKEWCFISDEDYYLKLLPALDEFDQRRQRAKQT